MKPRISIIVLSWNTREFLGRCLRSLGARLSSPSYEVIVVDNASEDGSSEMVAREFRGVRLIVNSRNLGYAAGNNIGIEAAHGDFIVLLNSDVEVVGDALEVLADFLADHAAYGLAAPRLINPDGSVQKACHRFPGLAALLLSHPTRGHLLKQTPPVRRYLMRDFDHLTSRDVQQPPGTCLAIPRRVVQEVGLIDERFFLFFNDVDYCRRIAMRGYRTRYLAEARLIHHRGRSVVRYGNPGSEWYLARCRYFFKWYGRYWRLMARLVTTWGIFMESLRAALRRLVPGASDQGHGLRTELRANGDLVRSVWRDTGQGAQPEQRALPAAW